MGNNPGVCGPAGSRGAEGQGKDAIEGDKSLRRLRSIEDPEQRRAVKMQLAEMFKNSAVCVCVPDWFQGWVALRGELHSPRPGVEADAGLFEVSCLGATVTMRAPYGRDLSITSQIVVAIKATGGTDGDGAVLARGSRKIVPMDYLEEHVVGVHIVATFQGGPWGYGETGVEGMMRFPIRVVLGDNAKQDGINTQDGSASDTHHNRP